MESKCQLIFEPLPDDDPRKRRPDISKAKRVLGWEPKVVPRRRPARNSGIFQVRRNVSMMANADY